MTSDLRFNLKDSGEKGYSDGNINNKNKAGSNVKNNNKHNSFFYHSERNTPAPLNYDKSKSNTANNPQENFYMDDNKLQNSKEMYFTRSKIELDQNRDRKNGTYSPEVINLEKNSNKKLADSNKNTTAITDKETIELEYRYKKLSEELNYLKNESTPTDQE